MKKIIFYLLLLLNFLLPLAIISNTLDGDLGWHLRFGQSLHTEAFPYLDTYTYSKYGTPWTNHEWGGDWLFWLVYSKIGYFGLVFITSLAITLAFLFIAVAFSQKINSKFLAISLVCQWSLTHIFVARLAMFTPLFMALTIFILEKSKKQSLFLYGLIPTIYLWSAIHGSWILAFIIINIYLCGNILNRLIPAKYQLWAKEDTWKNNFIYKIILIQITAAATTIINPYGIKIWQEIIAYFGQNYYKAHITEWVPSYTFPIFWKILIIQTIALVFVIYGFKKKKISLDKILLFCAFYYVAIAYKRQAILIGLLSVPVLNNVSDRALIVLKNNKFYENNLNKKLIYFFLIFTLIILSISYILKTNFNNDIWKQKTVTENNSLPYEGTRWLINNSQPRTKIFNEFSWGGYLNWNLPNDLIYFDGRGTATWMYDQKHTMLEHYFSVLDSQSGLTEIKQDGVDYVFLRRTNFIPMAKPDLVNNWFFGTSYQGAYTQATTLEQSLEKSTDWKKVYSDKQSNIWQRVNRAQ